MHPLPYVVLQARGRDEEGPMEVAALQLSVVVAVTRGFLSVSAALCVAQIDYQVDTNNIALFPFLIPVPPHLSFSSLTSKETEEKEEEQKEEKASQEEGPKEEFQCSTI